MSESEILVKVAGGCHVLDAATEVLGIASRLGRPVTMRFGDTDVCVRPTSTVQEVHDRWCEAYDRPGGPGALERAAAPLRRFTTRETAPKRGEK